MKTISISFSCIQEFKEFDVTDYLGQKLLEQKLHHRSVFSFYSFSFLFFFYLFMILYFKFFNAYGRIWDKNE